MLLNETITIMKLPKELTTVTKLSKYLAMVVFIALPIVGFFLGMRYQETMDLAKHQQMEANLLIPRAPTPTPIPIPTVDPSITASWKTYRSTTYGFEFKYPPTWFLLERGRRTVDYFRIARIFPNREALEDFKNDKLSSDQVIIAVIDIPTEVIGSSEKTAEFLEESIKETKESWCQVYKPIEGDKEMILVGDIIVEKVSISGVTATKVRCSEDAIFAKEEFVRVFVPWRKSMILEISLQKNPNLPLSPSSLVIFSQILSTFQFLP